jgi:hypothetical protein
LVTVKFRFRFGRGLRYPQGGNHLLVDELYHHDLCGGHDLSLG